MENLSKIFYELNKIKSFYLDIRFDFKYSFFIIFKANNLIFEIFNK